MLVIDRPIHRWMVFIQCLFINGIAVWSAVVAAVATAVASAVAALIQPRINHFQRVR